MAQKSPEKKPQNSNFIRLLNTQVLSKKLLATTAMTMACLLTMASSAYAVGDNENPTNPNVVGGSASFSGLGTNDLTVTQTNTNRTVIDWDTFNIGANAQTEFQQLNNASITVNQVTGGIDPSQILGTLKSTVNGQTGGKVMILDPNGVIFGANATIDVGGIIATTGTFDNQAAWLGGAEDIQLGNMDANGNTEIINHATINVADGGLLAFVAPTVKHTGIIQARQSYVALAAGQTATLDFYGDSLINVAVSGTLADALVESSAPVDNFDKGGQIYADGGTVLMTAGAAKSAVDSIVNMHGVIRANSFNSENGKIVLASAGAMNISGQVQSRNETPSTDLQDPDISITGDSVNITNDSHHFFSGVTDGIFTHSLSALDGDGGSVSIWGASDVSFTGFIDSGGGLNSGNGGNVSISSAGDLSFNGTVDGFADNGTNSTLTLGADIATISTSALGPVINTDALAAALGSHNVNVVGNSQIILAEDTDLSHWDFGGLTVADGNLTLQAPTIDLLHDLTIGSGDLAVNAQTINLDGRLYRNTSVLNDPAASTLLDQEDLAGTAPVVSVLSSNALIQQGIDLALGDSNTVVNVNADTYFENIHIYKSLTLQGIDGPNGRPLISGVTPGGTVVLITADDVTVDNFDIQGKKQAWLIDAYYAQAYIAPLLIGSGGVTSTKTYSSRLLASSYKLFGMGGKGIVAQNVSNVTLTNNGIANYLGYGIILNNVAGALVQNNTISTSVAGIRVIGGSDIELIDNTIMSGITGIDINGSSDDLYIVDNSINNTVIGLDATSQNNGYINISGNQFTNNNTGIKVHSGLIDLTGTTNTFIGGNTAMIFDGPFSPASGYTGLSLVSDTIGTTVFSGQSGHYIVLRNGAFYDPAQPTAIDGTSATYDGVLGGLMTQAQMQAIQAKIHDYDDDSSLGQIFFGSSS